MLELFHFDLITFIQALGYLGLFAIVFAESGLFFGFFFPGDSLLFTAGLLASQGIFDITILTIIITLGAILGDNVGYWFGAKVGPVIFNREDSFFFHKRHVERTRLFYLKHGSRAIVLARFVPIVRTFAPILAGVGTMPYKEFLKYNLVGGILWGMGVTLLGYFLGNTIPGIERYLFPIIIAIILTSFIPVAVDIWKEKRGRR